LPFLEDAGIKQYLLEVLTDNKPAINLYEGVGFKIVRTFNCFMQDVALLQLQQSRVDNDSVLKQMALTTDVLTGFSDMWDFQPSWQNSIDAILRSPADFVCIAAYKEEALCGYGIIEAASGDIPQIAVRKDRRRQGIGSQLLTALMKHNQHTTTKIINAEAQCTSLTSFLLQNGYVISAQQYEMIKPLS
jgi:ribosomal protein S18 acetylase RimI-like enzyme